MRKDFNKHTDDPEVKDIHFWITSPKGNYSKLYCDLVFVVADKVNWCRPNDISRNEPPAESDSDAAFEEHYAWVKQHCLSDQRKKYGRFTLKADPLKSFQPQDEHGGLFDIRPFLEKLLGEEGITALEEALGPRAKNSFAHPFPLDEQQALALYAMVLKETPIQRTGTYFAHPEFEKERKSQKRRQHCTK